MYVYLELRPANGGTDAVTFTTEVLGACEAFAARNGLR